MYTQLLVAIDGSKVTGRLVSKSVEEAIEKQASLMFIRVLEIPDYLWHTKKMIEIMDRTKEFLEDELQQMIADLSQQVPREKMAWQVIFGNPKQKILEESLKYPSQETLLIIGATGESEESLVGSTTTHIINFAPCDVLVVR